MPFTEFELKYIEKTVGKMCELRSPTHLHDKLQIVFEVKGYDVIVSEKRPRWDDPLQWLNMPIAKFKFIKKDKVWKLYWMRKDMKWHSYFEMPNSSKNLEALVQEVDGDPQGAF